MKDNEVFVNLKNNKIKKKNLLLTIRCSLNIQQLIEEIRIIKKRKVEILEEMNNIFISINKKKEKVLSGFPKNRN